MIDTTKLRKETISKVQGLIDINIDSDKGFQQAAETIESPSIAHLFREIAATRAGNASELKAIVGGSGGETDQDGSASGTLRRWWLQARGALNGGDDHVVLIEAERGEDAIKERYEEVLKETGGSAITPVLNRQYAQVKAQHDRIRDLRDARAN